MNYTFSNDDIKQQILDFMRYHDLSPVGYEDIITDGKIHRYRIHGDKPSSKSGAYCVFTDYYPTGWIKNWRTGELVQWHFKRDSLDDAGKTYFTDAKYQEMIEKSRKHQAELNRQLAREHAEAATHAADIFNNLPPAPEDFPYLVKKKVRSLGLKYYPDTKSIAVPLRNADGDFMSLQWINEAGEKKFYSGASTRGAFFSVALDLISNNPTLPILVSEGYATMATVYDLTALPCVAAMNCHNLIPVCEGLKKKYPAAKIIILADNDAQTEGNPGLKCAQDTQATLKLSGVLYPKFKRRDKGTDWNDFSMTYGEEETRAILEEKIKILTLPKDRQKVMGQVEQINAEDLKSKPFSPLKWAVEGFLPAGLSILAGGPKVGKSILSLHLSLSVAIGGYAFGKIKVEQGDVLYLALEDTQRRLQERIEGADLSEDTDLSRLTLTTRVPRQHEGGLQYIRWWLEDHENSRLVIIDTLQKFRKQLSGKNSMYSEDYDVVSEIKQLADEFDVPFLIIHHLKKAMSEDWLNEISGSQGIAGAADTIFALKRARTENGGLLYRTGRDVEEKDFAMRLDRFGWILEGDATLFTMPDWKRQIIDYLKEHNSVSPLDLATVFNMNINTVKTHLRRLEKEKLINKVGYGTYSMINQ